VIEREQRVRRLLVREGRKYRLVGVAADGGALYEHRGRLGNDYWVRTANALELSWSYRTCFGRKRPLPPAGGGDWSTLAPLRVSRRSWARIRAGELSLAESGWRSGA
jgi:hypothetical protein